MHIISVILASVVSYKVFTCFGMTFSAAGFSTYFDFTYVTYMFLVALCSISTIACLIVSADLLNRLILFSHFVLYLKNEFLVELMCRVLTSTANAKQPKHYHKNTRLAQYSTMDDMTQYSTGYCGPVLHYGQ